MTSKEYDLWKQLTPCKKYRVSAWMNETDAIFEVTQNVLRSTGVEIGIKDARDVMRQHVKEKTLAVQFRPVGGSNPFREITPDSIDIVFDRSSHTRVYELQFWSDDICSMD